MRAHWSLVALMIAGCGGGDSADAPDATPATTDITGWYGSVVKLAGDCGSIVDTNLAPALVYVDSLGGTTSYVRGCADMNDTDCPSLYYDFNTPIENGWTAEGGSAFFSAECTLSWERSTATLVGDTLRVHTLSYTTVGDRAQAECTLEAAAALTMPCTYETELTATKL